MTSLVKKFVAASAIAATAAFAFPALTADTAHAQVAAFNPVSQWIVLGGLFNPYYGGLYGGAYAPYYGGYYGGYAPYYGGYSPYYGRLFY